MLLYIYFSLYKRFLKQVVVFVEKFNNTRHAELTVIQDPGFLSDLQAPLSAHYITGGPNGAMATVKRTSAVGTLATHV